MRTSSSTARKLTTTSARLASGGNSSSKARLSRVASRSRSSVILSASESRSTTTSWTECFGRFARAVAKATRRSVIEIGSNGRGPDGTISGSASSGASNRRAKTSQPSWSRAARARPASLKRSYSRSRRTSSSRGSASSTASSGAASTGRSIFDLMWRSVAAMTSHSAATSMFSSSISSRQARYCSVTSAIGMSRMSSFWLRMRWSRRSSGPSKLSSLSTSAGTPGAP